MSLAGWLKISLIGCFPLIISCQSIYEGDRVDPINPYAVYGTEQNQAIAIHDSRKPLPPPESLSSYSFKPVRSGSGKISKTTVSIRKIGPSKTEGSNTPSDSATE